MTQAGYYAVSTIGMFVGYLLIYFTLVHFFGCKHVWELVDKTELESRLETITKHIQNPEITPWERVNLSQRRLVLAMRCGKCGRAKIHKIDSV